MDKSAILISIVVPIYNVEKYLQSCIDSLCAQTHKNLEIILVDDGSSDESGRICDAAAEKDSRIRVIHKSNSGVAEARNVGLNQIHGEYVSFSDSDDVYAPYFVDCLLDACLQSGAEISVGKYENFYDEISFDRKSEYAYGVITGKEAVEKLIGREHIRYTIVNNKLYEAQLVQDIRFLAGKIHEDEDFMYRMLYKAKKVCTVDAMIYGYRIRPNSITTAYFRENRMDVLEIAKKRAEFFLSREEQHLYINFQWTYAMLLLQHYPRARKELKDPVLAGNLIKEYRKIAPELISSPHLSKKRKLMTAVFFGIPKQYTCIMERRQKSIKEWRENSIKDDRN